MPISLGYILEMKLVAKNTGIFKSFMTLSNISGWGGSELGSFQITSSALDLGVGEILLCAFKSGVYFPQLSRWEVSLTVLQSQMFWGLVLLVQDPLAGSPVWSSDPLLLW